MFKDIFKKRENQLMLGIIIVSVILIIIGFSLLNEKGDKGFEPRKIPNSTEEVVWKEYKNKEYDFVAQYPEHFKVFEDDHTFGRVFNFYFDKGKNLLPFDHFVNQSHISIYPEGVMLTGPDHFEYYEQSNFTNQAGFDFIVREYRTKDGKTWAILARPEDLPKNWLDIGFIWISSEIKNPQSRCFDGDTEVSLDYCNVLEGDVLYVDGEIDEEFIEVGREFLDKISFE